MLVSTLVISVALGSSPFVTARPLNYPRAAAITDFGSCEAPTIEFAAHLDGRTENAFEPVNEKSFNHGSADKIAVITGFVCQQLQSSCKAGADAIAACATGEKAAAALAGGASADAFNAAFGITTSFASLDAGSASSSSSSAAANSNSPAQTAAAQAAAPAASSAASSSTSSSTTSSAGGNLQTFAGSLGASPPPVTASGTQFLVQGNSAFNNLQNALERSCDVQHNKCSSAANASGNKGNLNQNGCQQQQDQCNAQGKGAQAPAAQAPAAKAPAAAAASGSTSTATAAATGNESSSSAAAAGNAAPSLGKCSNPTIVFAAGLPGRKATEEAFEPANESDFPHGSALNPNIITQFICDTFTNTCGANQAAKNTCREAQAAVAALSADVLKTQTAADTFNGLVKGL